MNTRQNRNKKAIERLLGDAGWSVQDQRHSDPRLSHGVAVRDFPLSRGYGMADYLLYVDGRASGIIEVEVRDVALTGIESGAEKYRRGLPFTLPLYTRPLPFLYQSNGAETRFTNGFDPEPWARSTFAFHKPEILKEWIEEGLVGGLSRDMAADALPEYGMRGMTLLHRLWINMPPLRRESGLIPKAIQHLETSLRQNNARTLISMRHPSDHLPTALHMIYRLLKFAGARRVLYLVNDDSLEHQALEAFQRYVYPDGRLKFTEAFIAQALSGRRIYAEAKVCVTTPAKIIDLLQEKARPNERGEEPKNAQRAFTKRVPIKYNPDIPIESFDLIFIDASQQGNGLLLEEVATYFDAYLIGFSSSPDEKTLHFFQHNLVTEDGDGASKVNRVNVSFDL